jgi:hypothetical protein
MNLANPPTVTISIGPSFQPDPSEDIGPATVALMAKISEQVERAKRL